MALIKADRVKETSTSSTTANFILGGAAVGYRSFGSVCSAGDTFYYGISNQSNGEWEVGLGTYGITGTLDRTTVYASSNANAKVNFSAGTKECFITLTKNWIDTFLTATSGTTNYVTKTTGTGTVGDSQIFDNGTNVGIGTASPSSKLHIVGNVTATVSSASDPVIYQLSQAGGNTYGAIGINRNDGSGVASGIPSALVIRSGDTTGYPIQFATANTVRATIDGSGNVGIGTTSPAAQLHTTSSAAATKALVVRGASGQSANLQEWQNSSGTALATIDSAGSGSFSNLYAAQISGSSFYRDGSFTKNIWAGGTGGFAYREFYITRTLPDTVGDYVELFEFVHTLGSNFKFELGAVDYPYWDTNVYEHYTVWDSSSYAVPPKYRYHRGTSDYQLEKVYGQTNPYTSRFRVKRIGARTNTGSSVLLQIRVEAWLSSNFGSEPITMMSGTGTSSITGYASGAFYSNPTITPPPPLWSGNGTGITIAASSASGTGDGGSILLQAGAYATSGSNGKVIVRGLASNTANLQEWQNNAGSTLSAVNSAGDFTNNGGKNYSEKFGQNAAVGDIYATAIGYNASAGQLSTAVGSYSVATSATATAVGVDANAGGGGTAIGRSAVASGGAVAIGINATASNVNSIAIGRYANSSGQGIAIGYNFTGSGVGYTSFCASTNGSYGVGAIDVYAGDGASLNTNISRQHSIYGTWATSTYASRLGRVQLRVNDYTTDREAIRYESDGANALTSIGGSAIIANTTLAVQPAVSGNKGIVVKGASGQSANLLEVQNSSGNRVSYIDSAGNVVICSGSTSAIGFNSSTNATYGNYYLGISPSGYFGFYDNVWNNTYRLIMTNGGSFVVGDTSQASTSGPRLLVTTGPDVPSITGASRIGLVVKGSASQTANLQEWQSSSGTALAYVASNGHAYFGNVYIGPGSGTATYSTGIGAGALGSSTTGYGNTAVGYECLYGTTTTSEATAVGWQALKNGTGGGTAVGIAALAGATGSGNTGIGNYAGNNVGSGAGNVFVGSNVGPQASTSNGIFIGVTAGRWQSDGGTAHTGGSRSIHIGHQTAGSAAGDYNTIVIGYGAVSRGQNTTVIGNSSTTANYFYGSTTSTMEGGTYLKMVRPSDGAEMASLGCSSGTWEAFLSSNYAPLNLNCSGGGLRMGNWSTWADSTNAQVMWLKNSNVIWGNNALGVTNRTAFNTSYFQITAAGYNAIPAPTSRLEVYGDARIESQAAATKGLIVKGASGQSANLLEVQNSSGQSGFSVSTNAFGEGTISGGLRYVTASVVEFTTGINLQYLDSFIDRLNVKMHGTSKIGFATLSAQNTNTDTFISRGAAGVLRVNAESNGGSVAIPSSTPSAFTADQNDLALTASGFQRLSGTAARNITGIAPPSGSSHVDGRMMRIVNVGTNTLTFKQNSSSSTAGNRFYSAGGTDIAISANGWLDLIYDATDNGSGSAGWRIKS